MVEQTGNPQQRFNYSGVVFEGDETVKAALYKNMEKLQAVKIDWGYLQVTTVLSRLNAVGGMRINDCAGGGYLLSSLEAPRRGVSFVLLLHSREDSITMHAPSISMTTMSVLQPYHNMQTGAHRDADVVKLDITM